MQNARTGKFLSSQQITELVQELIDTQIWVSVHSMKLQNLGSKPVSKIEGRNGGTYVCRELVACLCNVDQPVIPSEGDPHFRHGNQRTGKLSGQAADKMQAGVILLDFMRRELNLSNSSVLGLSETSGAVGLPNLAPRYAIDAPADAHDGSSRPTLSLSALLKQYGIRLTANQAYHQWRSWGSLNNVNDTAALRLTTSKNSGR